MTTMMRTSLFLGTILLVCNTNAMADVTVTQGASAPMYTNTLNFDEPGQQTGPVPGNYWNGIGITEFVSGVGDGGVGDVSGIFPWINDGNAFEGPFGVFIRFAGDLTGFSAQVWDPSGPPGPFGGGFGVFVFNDADPMDPNPTPVATLFGEPAWGGLPGDGEWVNISTTGGMVFDEVRILGFGFSPTTYVDNLSWDTSSAIPEPGSCGLIFMAAATIAVRRRK
jgi:hypothetical protein